MKTRKILIILLSLICLFIVVGNVSASENIDNTEIDDFDNLMINEENSVVSNEVSEIYQINDDEILNNENSDCVYADDFNSETLKKENEDNFSLKWDGRGSYEMKQVSMSVYPSENKIKYSAEVREYGIDYEVAWSLGYLVYEITDPSGQVSTYKGSFSFDEEGDRTYPINVAFTMVGKYKITSKAYIGNTLLGTSDVGYVTVIDPSEIKLYGFDYANFITNSIYENSQEDFYVHLHPEYEKYNGTKKLHLKLEIYKNDEIVYAATKTISPSQYDQNYYFNINLKQGTYDAKAYIVEKPSYYVESELTVKPARIIFYVSSTTAYYKNSKYFEVVVYRGDYHYAKNTKVKLKIYTGKKYKTVTLTTNSQGIAKYNTKNLNVGTHKVVVTVNKLTKTSKIVIKKKTTSASKTTTAKTTVNKKSNTASVVNGKYNNKNTITVTLKEGKKTIKVKCVYKKSHKQYLGSTYKNGKTYSVFVAYEYKNGMQGGKKGWWTSGSDAGLSDNAKRDTRYNRYHPVTSLTLH